MLIARSETVAFKRAMQKLCSSDRGRLEARRFNLSEDTEGVEYPLPEIFEVIDVNRRHTLFASILPSWAQLCDGPFKTMMDTFLQSSHRGESEYAKFLSGAFRVLMVDPLDTGARRILGFTWVKLGRSDIARAWSQSAVALAPDDESNHLLHVAVLNNLKENNEAFDASALAVDLGKANDEILATYSDLLWSIPRLDVMATWVRMPNLKDALGKAAKSRLNDPQLRPAALMAMSLLALSDRCDEEAIELQKEALRLAPDNSDFHSFHYELFAALGRKEEGAAAIETHATALRRTNPDYSAETFAVIAWALLKVNKKDSLAYAHARAGLQLEPESPKLVFIHARILLDFGRLEEAFDELRRVSFSDAEFASEAALILGQGLSDAGRSKDAIDVWKHLQKLEPDNAAGFRGAGIDLWILDQDAEAAEMIARCVSLDDSDSYAWGLLGRILRALGRLDEAVPALEHALTFEQPPKQALRNLASVLISLGRIDDALKLCDGKLVADATCFEAAAGRLEALSANGEIDKAMKFGLSWMRSSEVEADDLIGMREAIEKHIGVEAALLAGEVERSKHPKAVDLLGDQALGKAALGSFPSADLLAQEATELQPEKAAPIKALAYACSYNSEVKTWVFRQAVTTRSVLP